MSIYLDMSVNKYLEIYEDIFPGNNDINELKIHKSYDLNWLTFGTYDYMHDINLTKESIIKLIDTDYVIFLTNKYFHYNLRGNGLNYLRKTKIICLNYYLKYIIVQKLNVINEIIKSENKKYSKLKLNIKKILKKNNLKPIYFLENEILPNTLYRKIQFGQEEIFMSFNIYAFKRIEYKLKTLCQLVEKMGAIDIDIRYTTNKNSEANLNVNATILNNNLGASIVNENKKKNDFSLFQKFNPNNQINNINLNIHDLEKIIDKENEFYISKEQFEADIDIKFLLNARCVNLVEVYNTKLIFEYMNKFERQLKIKAENFGLDLNFVFKEDEKEELFIEVHFLDPFKYLDCINGYNISPYSSGFNHLTKLIIKIDNIYHKKKIEKNILEIDTKKSTKDNDIDDNVIISTINCNKKDKELYLMINYFLEAHIKLFNEKKKSIDLIYNTNIDLLKAYNHIINTNFISDQIQSLFYYFFRDNLSYKTFEKFRNILIKPMNNIFDFFVKSNYFNLKINNNNKFNFYDIILNTFDNKYNTDIKILNKNSSFIIKPDECNKLIYIDKMVFISYQYHNILDYRLKIMDMLDEALEKIRIKLIKTCYNLIYIIDKESDEWEYIFKYMDKINNGNKKKIEKLKKRFNIEYVDNSIEGIELKKFYKKCKDDYDKIQKPEIMMNDISYISNFFYYFNNYTNNINYNKKEIQSLIKNYISKSLFDISILIKVKTINSISFDISEMIPLNKKFLDEKTITNTNLSSCRILKNNLGELIEPNVEFVPLKYEGERNILQRQHSINKIIIEPKLYLSPDRFNKNIMDTDDFILQILCFLMESHYEDDDANKKYNLKDNFNKIQSDINYNFELLALEIKNVFDKFFYKENGFFSKKEYNNQNIKNELINMYNNKVSDLDEKIILIFHLLFENGYINFSKINSSQSVFDNMYNLFSDIIKNYEKHKNIPEAIDIKCIKKNFPLSKMILTYQRYKIFFTYEDFSKYFFDSYNIDDIDIISITKFKENLNKINYTTFNLIYNIFYNETHTELKVPKESTNINSEIILLFDDIYKNYYNNPKINNYLKKIFEESNLWFINTINIKKKLTKEIENNNNYNELKNIIFNKNKEEKKYFIDLVNYIHHEGNYSFDGYTNLCELLNSENDDFLKRVIELLFNLIMNKLGIKYTDLDNENYALYFQEIMNKLKNNSTRTLKSLKIYELASNLSSDTSSFFIKDDTPVQTYRSENLKNE